MRTNLTGCSTSGSRLYLNACREECVRWREQIHPAFSISSHILANTDYNQLREQSTLLPDMISSIWLMPSPGPFRCRGNLQ